MTQRIAHAAPIAPSQLDAIIEAVNEFDTNITAGAATTAAANGARLLSIGPVAAKSATDVHALYDNTSAAFPGPFTNPDVPRNLRVTMSASWDGGDVTVTGTNQFGAAVSETFATGSGVVRVGTKIFKTVTGATKATPAGVGGSGASIGTGDLIGVAAHLDDTVGLAWVGTTIEAVTLEATYHSASFTTTPAATTYKLLANIILADA